MSGAWPFLVGGVICLVNSVNERDLNLLNRDTDAEVREALGRLGLHIMFRVKLLLRGTIRF